MLASGTIPRRREGEKKKRTRKERKKGGRVFLFFVGFIHDRSK